MKKTSHSNLIANIYFAEKSKESFLQIPNHLALSMGAEEFRIFSIILSKRNLNQWHFNLENIRLSIAEEHRPGKNKFNKAINFLKSKGYIKQSRVKSQSGKFYYRYVINENPPPPPQNGYMDNQKPPPQNGYMVNQIKNSSESIDNKEIEANKQSKKPPPQNGYMVLTTIETTPKPLCKDDSSLEKIEKNHHPKTGVYTNKKEYTNKNNKQTEEPPAKNETISQSRCLLSIFKKFKRYEEEEEKINAIFSGLSENQISEISKFTDKYILATLDYVFARNDINSYPKYFFGAIKGNYARVTEEENKKDDVPAISEHKLLNKKVFDAFSKVQLAGVTPLEDYFTGSFIKVIANKIFYFKRGFKQNSVSDWSTISSVLQNFSNEELYNYFENNRFNVQGLKVTIDDAWHNLEKFKTEIFDFLIEYIRNPPPPEPEQEQEPSSKMVNEILRQKKASEKPTTSDDVDINEMFTTVDIDKIILRSETNSMDKIGGLIPTQLLAGQQATAPAM